MIGFVQVDFVVFRIIIVFCKYDVVMVKYYYLFCVPRLGHAWFLIAFGEFIPLFFFLKNTYCFSLCSLWKLEIYWRRRRKSIFFFQFVVYIWLATLIRARTSSYSATSAHSNTSQVQVLSNSAPLDFFKNKIYLRIISRKNIASKYFI